MNKIIYDFGMNNGDDVLYYIAKGYSVIGIEADPALCNFCHNRFVKEVARGDLRILNAAVSTVDIGSVTFYIHKTRSVLSQIHKPSAADALNFREIIVPCRTASSIIAQFGQPHYVKFDIEGFDLIALRDIFHHGIRPDFVSAEIQTVEIFCAMVSAGYKSFNIVDGRDLSSDYSRRSISTPTGNRSFTFSGESSGPFAEDIQGEWLDADAFLYRLAEERLDAWKDIHASLTVASGSRPHVVKQLPLREHLSDLIPSMSRAVKSRLRRLRNARCIVSAPLPHLPSSHPPCPRLSSR